MDISEHVHSMEFDVEPVGDELIAKRKNLIYDMLNKNNCVVTFTKVNGELREMPCSLREDIIPKTNEEAREKKENINVLNVWCLDKKEWRSFRVANVRKVEVIYE